MNKKSLQRSAVAILGLIWSAFPVFAQPAVSVVDQGDNGSGNRQWLVQISPDEALINLGEGSLAVELGFEISGSTILSVAKNAADWPFNNPGDNPFTGSVGVGINVNATTGTIFAALGSDLFASAAGVDFITIVTAGLGTTTLDWGGQTVLPGSLNEFIGGRISQAGINFDSIIGSLTAGSGPDCDFNGNGSCTITDLDQLYAALGTTNPTFDLSGNGTVGNEDITEWLASASTNDPSGRTFVRGDTDLNGNVGGNDFTTLASNFGGTALWSQGNFDADGVVGGSDFTALASNFGFTSVTAVPEPGTLAIALFGFALLFLRRR